ncbi:hypothetical protein CEXT_209161 [Caerostris extrusa]|uniref:Uncharacterized protein n=1 Tax=Caerostris extrusa TaxID=172846 RepID=A0AAV4MGC4_CAEEX|nr:hypothetical protein CEXT_209161 [Caerostris extrusa]
MNKCKITITTFLKQTTRKEISDIHRCYTNSEINKRSTSISSRETTRTRNKRSGLKKSFKPLHSKKGKPSKQRKQRISAKLLPRKIGSLAPVPSSPYAHAPLLKKDKPRRPNPKPDSEDTYCLFFLVFGSWSDTF